MGNEQKVHPPFQHGFKPFTLYLQKLELLNICDVKFVSIIVVAVTGSTGINKT